MRIHRFIAVEQFDAERIGESHLRFNLLQRAEPQDSRRRRDKDARWLEGPKESSAMSHKIHDVSAAKQIGK